MRAWRSLAPAAVVGVGVVVAVAVAALHRPTTSSVRVAGPPVATLRTLSPAEPQFGDAVVATVELVIDTSRVDPRSVELDARFAPFSVTSTVRSSRETGGVSVVRVVDRLECLGQDCVPAGETATVRLPPLRISYPGKTLALAWPTVRIHSRVQASDLAHPLLRVGPYRPQPESYRVPPGVAGWMLLAASLACALGALALLVRAALPSALPGRRRRSTPIERLLAELTSGNGGRRAALEALALELEPLDERLSFESRVLAWAPQEPEAEAISTLAGRVRTVVAP